MGFRQDKSQQREKEAEGWHLPYEAGDVRMSIEAIYS
jgi:hypothetical protein